MSKNLAPRSLSVVEIAIALAVLATLSLFAIPAFQSRRILENEASARRTLRAIVAAERTFSASHSGTTYGFLSELLGEGPLRKAVPVRPKALMAAGMRPHPPFHALDGYLFVVWLPGRGGIAVHEESWSNLSSELAGTDFVAVAWPINVGYSGQSAFVTDSSGVLLEFRNHQTGAWSGFDHVPPGALYENKERAFGPRTPFVRSLKSTPAADP